MNYAGTPTFCAIAPISYSHLVDGRNAHLVLAHLLDKEYQPTERHSLIDTYAEFIRQEKAAGAFIMLDNGAYELHESHTPEKLFELAAMVNADAIVLPDYPFQPAEKTIEAAEKFAPMFKEAGFKTFFVPQSKTGDREDWVDAYLWAANNPLIDIIGISILGVPNAWNNIDPTFARVVAMQHLLDIGEFAEHKHHHFLGLNAGPALEIPSLLRMGVLDTVDSSGPVWSAINGHRYSQDCDSYQAVRKLTSPVDFFMKLTKDQATLARIEFNVDLTDNLFNNDTVQTPWYAVE